MERAWLEPNEINIPATFTQVIGGNPLVSKELFQRGMTEIPSAKGFLSPQYYLPASPSDLPDLDKAAFILYQAIKDKKKIGVWGDFDVDGQTATTILVSALTRLGGTVTYRIPVRASETHGINLPGLQKFIKQGVEVLLTCDTGVSSHEAVEYAQDHRIPVLITDHHDLPVTLPRAEAIVNPKMLDASHPLSSLPGVGVAYKIVERLWQLNGEEAEPYQFLDLVALGIVADIALLRGDTRYLLQRGLEALRTTKRIGLLSIMEFADLIQANITEEHIAFVIAPRMNALGRLDDANQMVELLTTTDPGRGRILALELEGMNAQRKLLSDQVYKAAEGMIVNDPSLLDYSVLVLSYPTWPAGVIGIVASRLVEQYHRPVILFSAPAGQDAHGSARSIEPVNITGAIAANQGLVKAFGGHPMAAGLAINPEKIPDFRKAISQTVQALDRGIQKEKKVQIDGYLKLSELSLELVEDLERLSPFGAGNPPLVFATRNLKLTGYAVVGRNDEHLQLTIEDDLGYQQRSIWWQGAGFALPEGSFDLAYSVRASTYQGQRDIQVEWIDYRLSETQTIRVQERPKIEVIDFRGEPEPDKKIHQIRGEGELLIWGESLPKSSLALVDRFSLTPSEALAIWTIPPGLSEIQIALQKVGPRKVYLFANNPGMDDPEAFLKRLLGLLKFRIRTAGGATTFSSLAASTAQKISTVRIGLEWLQSHGHISLQLIKNDDVTIRAGSKSIQEGKKDHSAMLNSALSESAAFRRYYVKADIDQLVFLDRSH